MAQSAGPMWVLAAWAVGGLLSLAGAMTYAELGAMYPRAGGAIFAPQGDWSYLGGGPQESPSASAFGAMILAALWAYDGWNNLPMAAGEVKDPSRNVPRAIVGGTLGVLAIYAIVNIGYFH